MFHQVALMLALEVDTPFDGELEFVAALLKQLDTLGVGEAHEFLADH